MIEIRSQSPKQREITYTKLSFPRCEKLTFAIQIKYAIDMSTDAIFTPPKAYNEPVLNFAPGSPERASLKAELDRQSGQQIDVPMTIGGAKIRTDNRVEMNPPHDRHHVLGHYHKGNAAHVEQAIDAAMAAKPAWEAMPWQDRAAIFLKAADLLCGPYRDKMNAATMLGQSKNAFQAEIDAVAELADFWRFNVEFMVQLYSEQPQSAKGIWNRLDHRPLEGFVFAITPFNFTSIAGNLPTAPALMGNVVVWKVAGTQVYSARVIMEILEEAGLPAGVVNQLFVSGPVAGDVIFNHRDFTGLHFTGSTGVFQNLWSTIGNNIAKYKSYPRIVGETGGKDFVVAHESANPKAVATALARGAFEYQGQKCSAASRAYISASIWEDVRKNLIAAIEDFNMGDPKDFTNFVNAVIDGAAYKSITSYIDKARDADDAEIIAGGIFDDSIGYFIEPTVILTTNPNYVTLCDELFGPVLTIFVFDDDKLDETLALVDSTSPYALTGAIFAQDRYVLNHMTTALRHCAGNFYLNDKPTGAVVGQQPFGGARGSGTNDKAGSILNLLRWVSPRTIKENFNPPTDYRYPFMAEE